MGGKDHKKKVKQDNKDQQKAAHEKLQQDHHRSAIEEKKRERAARAAAPSAAAEMDEDGDASSVSSSPTPKAPPTRKARTEPTDVIATPAPVSSGVSDPSNAELKDLMLNLIATQRSDKANIESYMSQQAEILSTSRDKYEAESARTQQRFKAIEDQLARMSID